METEPIRRAAAVAIVALPFAILGAGLVAALAGHGWYAWLVREDGPAENLQFLACAGTAIGAGVLARRAARRRQTLRALICAGVALALFFVAGEEITWGQRLGGWRTPDTLASLNILLQRRAGRD